MLPNQENMSSWFRGSVTDLSLCDPHDWTQCLYLDPQLIIGRQSWSQAGWYKGHRARCQSLGPGPCSSLAV